MAGHATRAPARPRPRRRERGTGSVEFALTGLLFLILLLGMTDAARALWAYTSVAHAAAEAARWASVRGAGNAAVAPEREAGAEDIAAWARARAPGMDTLRVESRWLPDKQQGSEVEVRVEVDFSPLSPLLPALTLHSTSRMALAF